MNLFQLRSKVVDRCSNVNNRLKTSKESKRNLREVQEPSKTVTGVSTTDMFLLYIHQPLCKFILSQHVTIGYDLLIKNYSLDDYFCITKYR